MSDNKQLIAKNVEIIREANQKIADVKAELDGTIKDARAEIEELLIESGESWEDDNGYARISKPAKRITYNKKALEKLQDNDPQGVYAWLMDEKYRTEKTAAKGTLSIK